MYIMLLLAFPFLLFLYAYLLSILEQRPITFTLTYFLPVLCAYVIGITGIYIWRLLHAVYAF